MGHISIAVQEADFDLAAELAQLSQQATQEGAAGALASFTGLVRGSPADAGAQHADHAAAGRLHPVQALELEHYPGMTQAALRTIAEEAATRWPLLALRVIHRIGRLAPGAQIVFVGVAAAHRGDAFSACAFTMDALKTRAPFWKKETDAQGNSRWVDARASDDAAAARWG